MLYEGREVVQRSALGLVTDMGDYTKGLAIGESSLQSDITERYSLRNIKQRQVDYRANEMVITCVKDGMPVMEIIFRVSNRDVAFRYRLLPKRDTCVCVVSREASGFVLPEGTTTFLCPQSKPMGGFARSSPSYETPYTCDEPVGKNGWGEGYTFPCLFKTVSGQWVLISETGTDGHYVGCRLLNDHDGTYHVGFPQAGELNGTGSTGAALALPGEMPWRSGGEREVVNVTSTEGGRQEVRERHVFEGSVDIAEEGDYEMGYSGCWRTFAAGCHLPTPWWIRLCGKKIDKGGLTLCVGRFL